MKRSIIQEIRAFNRFYTNIIGLVDKHILKSTYSLPEVRIMYELYYNAGLTASEIMELLDIDKGYLSRILAGFEKAGMIKKVVSLADKRSASIQLTSRGKKEFEVLDKASDKQVEDLFDGLSASECTELVRKMKQIQKLLIIKKQRK